LNSKFLELALKLPKAFSDKELILRNDCSKQIERGKVNITVTVEYASNEKKAATIDQGLLTLYYNQLKQAATTLNDTGNNLLQLALTFPEVIKYEEDLVSEQEWIQLQQTFAEAMNNFQTFRKDEGRVLLQD